MRNSLRKVMRWQVISLAWPVVLEMSGVMITGVVTTAMVGRLGAVALTFAHLNSGLLNAQTLPLSAVVVIPALIGLWLGFLAHDRLDVAQFRRWTLVLLVLTGANLIRRAVEIAAAGL